MPTLHWIGKEKVMNHHLDVPFRVLEHRYGFDNGKQSATETNSGNKVIHGDNLEALKALLPEYEGRIKCIYIDPPYNTGNEGWVYNDNVNDPKIRKWLHSVVGKEGEDLNRHDKWLCMMYPRLKLLHKLLAEDGAIFISIDDNEHSNLKLLCDEIFGNRNHITSFIWRRRASSQLSQNNISVDHEYVVSYFKSFNSKFAGINKDYKNYSNPDNDPKGDWTLGDLTVGMTKDQRPNQFFDLEDPETKTIFKPNPKRVWTYAPDTMREKIMEKRVVFPKSKSGRPMLKRYLSDLKSSINPISSWLNGETYHIGLNSEGTKILQYLFDTKIFDYPKPVSLLQLLLSQVTRSGDIVLDSFAGSASTAHAVLNLNKQDGGNRKFILVEMEDYADSITAERTRRVITGYSDKEGTGGSFDFYDLGATIFDEEGNVNDAAGEDKIRRYIFYSETRSPLLPIAHSDTKYFLGKQSDTAYYLFYEPGCTVTLNYELLSAIKTPAERYIIYADNCVLTKELLAKYHIIFKKIPRDITRF